MMVMTVVVMTMGHIRMVTRRMIGMTKATIMMLMGCCC